MNKRRVSVNSPLSGTVVGLDAVPDPQFATGAFGAGIAVVPDAGVEVVEIRAPFHGRISRFAPNMYVFEELLEQIPVFRTDLRAARSLGAGSSRGAGSVEVPAGGAGSVEVPAGGAGSVGVSSGGAGSVEVPAGGAGSVEVPAGGAGSVEVPAGGAGSAAVIQPRKLLVHIGVDTGRLNGQGFAPHVEQGDVVSCGAPICTYVPRELGRMGFDPIVMMVALRQPADALEYQAMAGEPCNRGDTLFRF